jgi:hypothetical protein
MGTAGAADVMDLLQSGYGLDELAKTVISMRRAHMPGVGRRSGLAWSWRVKKR